MSISVGSLSKAIRFFIIRAKPKKKGNNKMRRIIAIALAAMMLLTLTACGGSKKESVNIAEAKSLADLAGAKIAAQAGTFHEDAMAQIKDVQSSTLPEFADLLTALKSGTIDGYVAEEPCGAERCGKELFEGS